MSTAKPLAINIEFVSAYPTRPLRGEDAYAAIVGDVLARMAETSGHDVTREYYVNDTGAQADALARGVFARCAAWETFAPDEITPIAAQVRERLPQSLWGKAEAEWLAPVRAASIEAALDTVRASLDALDVRFDVFTHESALETDGAIKALFEQFAGKGVLLSADGRELQASEVNAAGHILLDTVPRGDLRPRPLTSEGGSYTYYAADLAYHAGKLERGFERLIDVFRRDHASYAPGLVAGVDLMSDGRAALSVCLIDPVRPKDEGSLSPRAPDATGIPSLDALLAFYGPALLRRMMLAHTPGTPLELSLDPELRDALAAAEAQQIKALNGAPEASGPCEAITDAFDAQAPHALLAAADVLAEEILSDTETASEDRAVLAQMRKCLGFEI